MPRAASATRRDAEPNRRDAGRDARTTHPEPRAFCIVTAKNRPCRRFLPEYVCLSPHRMHLTAVKLVPLRPLPASPCAAEARRPRVPLFARPRAAGGGGGASRRGDLLEALRGVPRQERRGGAGQVRRAAARQSLGRESREAHRAHHARRQYRRLCGRGREAGRRVHLRPILFAAGYSSKAKPTQWRIHFDLPEAPKSGALLTVCIAATRGGALSIQCNDTKLPVRQIIEERPSDGRSARPRTAVPTTGSGRNKSSSIPVLSMRAETRSRCNLAAAGIPSGHHG